MTQPTDLISRRGLNRSQILKASTATGALLDRRTFLTAGAAAAAYAMASGRAHAAALKPEKDELKLGFIKLTDMAPLAVAKENGYFEDEGLIVTLEAQANWKVLLDRVITGELDGAHMLAGQPLAATIGFGTKAHIITPFSMDLNGNAITVSNEIWAMMKPQVPKDASGKPVHPIKADTLRPAIDKLKADGKSFKMGMVFPVSTHNYELRYWLASGGINPGFYSPEDVSGNIARRGAAVGNATAANAWRRSRPGPSTAIALVSPGTRPRCSRASACPSSPTTRSGRTIRKRSSA